MKNKSEIYDMGTLPAILTSQKNAPVCKNNLKSTTILILLLESILFFKI